MELIDREAAQALISGRHGAPFDVLGRHRLGKGWVVRVLVPEAEALFLLDAAAEPEEFEALGQGLFAIAAPRIATDYRLRARHNGADWEFDDPYRFGPVLGEVDEYLISEGTHRRLWQRLGAHPTMHEGIEGTVFAVWAPNARRVAVVGDFNHWNPTAHPMRQRGVTGVWEIFLPAIGPGALYKYDLIAPDGSGLPKKADPFGFGSEHPPANGSVVRRLPQPPPPERRRARAGGQSVDAPISIYEVHLGSWRRKVDRGGRRLSYPELAEELVTYVRDMGFTHIELMPISEFPFDGSWGYQPVGLYAPTIRHGTAEEFRDFVAAAHATGLGVILDWVPGHFPTDPHGLGWFDGTPLYQYADPREGFHRDWNTLIFDYGRREVRNYLTSNALYWLSQYGLDGLRVDAVASMLYRDYSRPEGEWVPNVLGGRENLEAIGFLREVNTAVYAECPGAMTVAEESTSFPGVSRPVHDGGLGFGFKWNMGWMNDTLDYIRREPVHRSYHHGQLSFGMVYAFSENFILPISHDEVVHGKGSMLGKMPGSGEEKFANLRAYYGFMWGHPGKKLLFMGCEFAQGREWNHDVSLDWHLLDSPMHAGVSRLVQDLNRLYRENRALYLHDTRPEGFEWLVADDAAQSVLAFLRKGGEGDPPVMVVCNFTPVERSGYRIGLPREGRWEEILNTDAALYGGGNRGNFGQIQAEAVPRNGQPFSAVVTLPPLATVFFRATG